MVTVYTRFNRATEYRNTRHIGIRDDGATVSIATSLPVQAGVALRRRFQKGTLIVRGKTLVRCGVYREDVLQPNGTFKRVQRCMLPPATFKP